ncbi:condensation domain-containing protein [Steroidobacter cummioxidans]|uniref:condensation domain-containing protein n=1 Tax=Steroidobacter cummioxidans TaxID=1803913 RepID=UPI00137B6963|nr:condensation domain-containing protein [Steroidobacter cummioxidans]
MNAVRQDVAERAKSAIEYIRERGGMLWSENGQLRYRMPKGALEPDIMEALRASKPQIMKLLDATDHPVQAGRPGRALAPLTFSQLAHWTLYNLGEKQGIRQVASVTRLRGRLNIDAFNTSADALVRHHDALRTRIVSIDGQPMQEIAEHIHYKPQMADLRGMNESQCAAEVQRVINEAILGPVDLARDALFVMRLLTVKADEHLVIMAMEHTISDAASMNILSRDLLLGYEKAMQGQAPSLPPVHVQFADFSAWQRSTLPAWLERHGEYWQQVVAQSGRLRFPADASLSPAAARPGWEIAYFDIERELRAELAAWCRQRRTTMVMAAFTAYIAVLMRWCDATNAVVPFQSDSRTLAKLENTVGFIASLLYFRIQLTGRESFLDLLALVEDEYCRATEHADSCYLESRVPRPDFTRNGCFNWIPQGAATSTTVLDGADALQVEPMTFQSPMRRRIEKDCEPSVVLFDSGDGVRGGVYFPLSRFAIETMNRFGQGYLESLRTLLRQPESLVKDPPAIQ